MAKAFALPASRTDQTFSYTAPAASTVLLVGDFTHWDRNPIAMDKMPDGVWRITVALPPGRYHYRFIVDDEWCDDPECQLAVPNPFGSSNAVLTVHDAGG